MVPNLRFLAPVRYLLYGLQMSGQPQITFMVGDKRFTFTPTTDYYAFTESGATGYLKHTFSAFLNPEISPVGRGSKAVRSARPSIVLSKPYQVAYLVTFTGTTGYFYLGTKRRQYIRPLSSQAKALAIAVAIARELSRQGRLWTGILRVHGTDAVYHLKGFQYWVRKGKGSGEVRPEVRLYPANQKVKGLRRRKTYTFDLIILYTVEPLTSKVRATLKEVAQHIIRSLKPEKEGQEERAEGSAIEYWLKRKG